MAKRSTNRRCRKPLNTVEGGASSASKAFLKATKTPGRETTKQAEAKEEKSQQRKRKVILKDIYSALDKALKGGQVGGRINII